MESRLPMRERPRRALDGAGAASEEEGEGIVIAIEG